MTLYRGTPGQIEKVSLDGFMQQTQQGETYIAVRVPLNNIQQPTQQAYPAQITSQQPIQQHYDNGFKTNMLIALGVGCVFIVATLATIGAFRLNQQTVIVPVPVQQPIYQTSPARY